MKGSYAMVDQAGRFYDNQTGTYNYSQPILEVGAERAIEQVNYNYDAFNLREKTKRAAFYPPDNLYNI